MLQYSTRRKEIEDSFIECGLEVPLVSRNLNATVNAVGPSFEPVGRDYRIKVEEEAKNRVLPDVPPSSKNAPVEDSDDVGVLKENVRRICDMLSEAEKDIVDASLNSDYSRREKLERESMELRTLRDRTISKIKSLESSVQPASEEQIRRIDKLEDEVRSLRVQISMLRENIGELMNQIDTVMESLGIERDMDEDEDD